MKRTIKVTRELNNCYLVSSLLLCSKLAANISALQGTNLRCLVHHDSSASFADALQYSESVLEVANVKAGHLQSDVAKVACAVHLLLPASTHDTSRIMSTVKLKAAVLAQTALKV
jgi:hypothetical protein